MTTFAKGHGTENDFIILPDPDARLDLGPEVVAALCDRRSGLGADGVLRVARAGALADAGVLGNLPDDVDPGDWFMDYRNADGSIAETCGNGLRVFGHYLVAEGLVGREAADGGDDANAADDGNDTGVSGDEVVSFRVGTRVGARLLEVIDGTGSTATVSVEMGAPQVLGTATAHVGGAVYAGIGVDMGNPHLACVLPGHDAETVRGLDLSATPEVPADMFPDGVNLEILTPLDGMPEHGVGAVDMRVIERGVGETRSCGSGTVAAAVAALADAARQPDLDPGAGSGSASAVGGSADTSDTSDTTGTADTTGAAGTADTTGTAGTTDTASVHGSGAPDHLAGAVTVRVPGGDILVEVGDGWSRLTGPSVIVARGTVDMAALALP